LVGAANYFGKREEMWKEPIYRNVWGLLTEFGDAEVASLLGEVVIVKGNARLNYRELLAVEWVGRLVVAGPPPVGKGRSGAAPGVLPSDAGKYVHEEGTRAFYLLGRHARDSWLYSPGKANEEGERKFLGHLLQQLHSKQGLSDDDGR